MNSDEGTVHPDRRRSFIFKRDEKFRWTWIVPSRFEIDTNNFNPKKLISLINPKIKKLELLCGYSKDRIDDAHKIYNLCLTL